MVGKRTTQIVMVTLLVILSILAVFPFYIMINMGTYYANDLYKGIKLLPANYFSQNFESLMKVGIWKYYINSIIVAIASSVSTGLVCAMAGYAFAKYKFKGKSLLFAIILLTMMIPQQLSLVGFVIEMQALGLMNSLASIIFPVVASPFGAFWMTQYTKNAVPESVVESGRLDGCNDFRIFVSIVFPFIIPAVTTLIMLSFLWSWNSFILPMIALSDERKFTIPLGILQLSTHFRKDIGAQILAVTFATIPMLIIFAVFSKNLISGLAAAAVKE